MEITYERVYMETAMNYLPSLASHVSTPTPAVLEPTFEGRGGVISAQKEFREHNMRILEGLKVINRQSRGLKY